jgi:NAD(P)-dependent dehydrogenase (short-subunit alcohol dehydrogenase family)
MTMAGGRLRARLVRPCFPREEDMLDLQLEGKRALVTGSSSGIGEAIARTLAGQGAAVVVHGRNAERAERVAGDINRAGLGRAVVALGDLSRQDEADRVAQSALEALGGIDILVDNAGRGLVHAGWLEASIQEWEELFEANLFSAVRMIRALVPGMKERRWGRVIQIASVVATQPFPGSAVYAATKAAMVNMTISLAKELGGTGVTVNSVSPGPIVTPLFEQVVPEGGADRRQFEANATYVGRFGRPEEIADLVAFLASPRADFIDATDVHIDGGRRDIDLLAARPQPRV